MTKYLKYTLLFAAPCLIIIGLSSGYMLLEWGPIPVGFIIAGIVCFLLWLIFQESSGQGFWGKRSTEASVNAIISTLSILIILGMVNFFVARYSYQVDLTENKQFSLAPKTQQLVKNLPSVVKVWVFSQTPDANTRELLTKYRRIADDRLTVEFVDPYEQPTLANKFEVRNVGDVYVSSGDGELREFVQSVNAQIPLAEEQLTNGLLRLIGDRRKVYFLQGHGERSLDPMGGSISQAIAALQAQNISTEPFSLVETKTVPDDANLVAIIGPKRALAPGEVNAIDDYLDRGGNLLLAIDPRIDVGLNGLLEKWGVELDRTLAIDGTGNGGAFGLGPAAPLITNYGDHSITKEFENGYSFYPLARPIQIKEVEGIEATPFLITNEPSWAETEPDNPTLRYDRKRDRPGPLYLGVALVRGDAIEPTTDSEAVENSNVTEDSETTSDAETTENSDSSEDTEATSDAETTENSDSSEDAEATEDTETTENSDITEDAEATEDTETTENSDITEDAEATEDAETASDAETTDKSDSPEDAEATQDGDPENSTEERSHEDAKMVVIGNSEFAINGLFELQLNGDVFLNSVNWLSGQPQEILSIRPQESTNRRILMMPIERRLVELILILLPVMGFGLGFILWLRRR